jgi:hypothetical protein
LAALAAWRAAAAVAAAAALLALAELSSSKLLLLALLLLLLLVLCATSVCAVQVARRPATLKTGAEHRCCQRRVSAGRPLRGDGVLLPMLLMLLMLL